MSRMIFDRDSLRFKKATLSFWRVVGIVFRWIIGSITVAALCYAAIAFVFSTDEERLLLRENRMYSKMYLDMQKQQKLVSDVVVDLQLRDVNIYKQIFETEPPALNAGDETLVSFSGDTLTEKDLVKATGRRIEAMTVVADRVEESLLAVFGALAAKDSSDQFAQGPPMSMPIKDLNYAQVGASVGMKLSPFYKVSVQHSGVDLIAAQGEPVYATAEGVVSSVTRSRKGLGNVVEIDHGNGYFTRYAHLADIAVRKGAKVSAGKKIAEIGISGNSLAPHLHYEVLRDTVTLDPVNYFFADITPEEYSNFCYMSTTTGQSLD